MKAAVATQYGDKEVLDILEIPRPTVKKQDHVLIEVHASSVNPIDWKLRKGMLKFFVPLKFPAVLGFDLCGKVVETGSNVTKFKPGDWVISRSDNKWGEAYAEYTVVSESALALKPKNLSISQSAALPLAGLTAYEGLTVHGKLQPEDTVFIHGASGGVGLFAVQIAKALGGRVTASCGTTNVEFVKSFQVGRVIDYKKERLFAEGDNYSCIYDAVGMLTYGKIKKYLKPGGRFVTTLPSPGVLFSTAFQFLPGKHGIFFAVKPNGALLEKLVRLVEAEKVKVIIDSEYKLDDIKLAHARSETGRARGKIIVQIRPQSIAKVSV